MFDYLFQGIYEPKHQYTLAATGIKFRDGEFTSRSAAESAMYTYINKHGIRIENVYDDKHYKTYICNNGIRFYINRV